MSKNRPLNPNQNCLDGKKCPKCRSYGPFEIVVSMRVLLCDSGAEDAEDGSIEYDGNSLAKCYNCEYESAFHDFDEASEDPA